ncbi:MAG TPA: NAD-dependent epimerase/dehydratase family protein [Solirubrobacteraceae bacterium]|nr:NAD-dependent epimerase/dehydratase family protein [Solirubrobacteraceae bacterium]
MRTLVTGGAGFIGSNLVDALLARGDEVVVVDNLTTGRESNLSQAQAADLVKADIREAEELTRIVKEAAPEAIFHLAAQIDVRKSVLDPAADARINVEGTVNVLEAARQANVQRLVNTSTGGAIYGDVDTIPTPESMPPAPMAGYGTSKYCAEQYCNLYTRLHGLSTVTVRLGNVFGPRQDPLGEAGVIAIFCGKLMDGGRPTIYGDGRQTRDYIYVGDVVRGQLAAADNRTHNGAFNIGTGQETSVLDLLEILQQQGGRDDFEPQFAEARLGEIERSCLDVTRARTELGWQAQTGLAEGMSATLEATRAQLAG